MFYNMELFARLSCSFTAGDSNIENDDFVNEALNMKLMSFIASKGITTYRILNAETSLLPEPAIGAGYEGVQCSLFLAYQSTDH